MSIDDEIEELTHSLQWMENKVGIQWSPACEKLERAEAWAIEGRAHLSMAARDNECYEVADMLSSDFLSQDIKWDQCNPAAWLAMIKHQVNAALELGHQAVGEDSSKFPIQTRRDFSDQVFQMIIPKVDMFAENKKVLETIGESKVLALWARAYSIAAWSQLGFNAQRANELLKILAEKLKRGVACADIRHAASFALVAIVNEENQDLSPSDVWELVNEIYDLNFQSDGNQKWLVGAVAELGRLSVYLPEAERQSALSRMHNLFYRWNDTCYADQNASYAIYNAMLAVIDHAVALKLEQLHVDDQTFIQTLMNKSNTSLSLEIASMDYVIEVLPEFLNEQALLACCNGFIRTLSVVDDQKEILLMTYALRRLTGQTGGKGLADAWGEINFSNPSVQVFWLHHVIDELNLTDGFKFPEIDAKGVKRFYQNWDENIPDELIQYWLVAVIMISSVSLLREDVDAIAVLESGFTGGGEIEQLAWLVVISILSLGEGCENPEQIKKWTKQVLAIEVSLDTQRILFAKIYALFALFNELKVIGSDISEKVESKLADLLNLNIEDEFLKTTLSGNDRYLVKMLSAIWYSARRQIDATGVHKVLSQLMTLEQRTKGCASSSLLYISQWLLRHSNAIDSQIRDDIKKIDRLSFSFTSDLATQDFVTFVPLSFKDAQFTQKLIMPIRNLRDTLWQKPWHLVSVEEKENLLKQMFPLDGIESYTVDDIDLGKAELPWFENVYLLRLSSSTWHDVLIYFLLYQDELYRLDGKSNFIHEVNEKARIQLTDENVLDYMRFFCFFVRGDEGPFYVLDQWDDAMLHGQITEAELEDIKQTIMPTSLQGKNNRGDYVCEATVYYSNAIFAVDFLVHATGIIEMIDDQPLVVDLSGKLNNPITFDIKN